MLIDYAGDALKHLKGSLGKQSQKERDKLLSAMSDQVLGQLGLPSGIGARIFAKVPLDDNEVAAITAR